jgi:hypothetical protein
MDLFCKWIKGRLPLKYNSHFGRGTTLHHWRSTRPQDKAIAFYRDYFDYNWDQRSYIVLPLLDNVLAPMVIKQDYVDEFARYSVVKMTCTSNMA